jgi:hypothetical protein
MGSRDARRPRRNAAHFSRPSGPGADDVPWVDETVAIGLGRCRGSTPCLDDASATAWSACAKRIRASSDAFPFTLVARMCFLREINLACRNSLAQRARPTYKGTMLRRDIISTSMDHHADWLRQFGASRVKHFERMRRTNPEGAACEALVAKYLRDCVHQIEPAEDLSTGGPDFQCVQDGKRFYVEATALATKAIEKAIWIPDDPKWEGGSVGSLSEIVRTAVCGKVRQCLRADAPTLVALGIHHSWASMDIDSGLVRDLLISDESYVVPVSATNPIPTQRGSFVTGLRNALFLEAEEHQVSARRQPVSGVMIFGLGILPLHVIGVLNDRANRPFDPTLLPAIEFAEAVLTNENRIGIRWHASGKAREG